MLIGEKDKSHYVLVHRRRKHFCRYCSQSFSTDEILKCYIKDCLGISGKQRIITPKNGEYVRFKKFERNLKSPFMIYAGFERLLVSEGEKKNPVECYNNKYKKYVVCSFGYKLLLLIIRLVSLLNHSNMKMLFTTLSVVW